MANEQQTHDQEPTGTLDPSGKRENNRPLDATDGLKDKKPEELTPEELRLMADTMPGDGPGDD